MDDILSKPYSLAELTRLMRQWVDTTQIARQPAVPEGAPRNLTLVDIADVTGIDSLAGDMPSTLYSRLVKLFEASSEDALSRIGVALTAHDWKSAQQSAHKLKGAAGNVGAHEFAAQLAELERSCNEGNAAVAHHSYKMLRAAMPALLATLKQHSLRASA
jgi:HPt (histidine-containing phosphotransfer) domain-containing protein